MRNVSLATIVLFLVVVTAVLSLRAGDHKQAEALLGTFYAQMLSSQFGAARESIDQAIRLWPENTQLYSWRAYCKSQSLPSQCPFCVGPGLSRMEAEIANTAIQDYRTALQINPRDAVAHHNLAWLNHLLRQEGAARSEFEKAIVLDPNNAVFHLSLGMLHDETGLQEPARAEYRTAIQLSPEIVNSPFWKRYAARLPEKARSVLRNAIAGLETELKGSNDPILKARLGKLYLCSQNIGRAFDLLRQAAASLPNLPLVWYNWGEIYAAEGNSGDALACFQRARMLNGRLTGPQLRIGELLRNRRPQAALPYFRSAANDWERMVPVTALHNQRLYGGTVQLIDDLLPTSLVWFSSPCESHAIYNGLAELSGDERYRGRGSVCEEMPDPHRCLRTAHKSGT